MTTTQYLIQLRINRAKNLLLHPDKSLGISPENSSLVPRFLCGAEHIPLFLRFQYSFAFAAKIL